MTAPAEVSPVCPVKPGDTLAGKFRVERVLGVGGMGVVLQAMHLDLGQPVALKLMLREMLDNAEAVARFLREARAAARLQSEHVVRVLDVGRLGSGEPFMVMEMLRGRDLAALLHAEGPQPVERTADYVLQACEAIAEAHAAGIVHRDLKPANLFVAERPDGTSTIKVLDFGISKITTGESGVEASMTSTQSMLGSPRYMSPEQMRSAKNVDARADIWALGVILYELLTGREVYEADTMASLVAQISVDPAPSMRIHRPDLPAPLDDIVLRCLEKSPERRWQNVAELARALLPYSTSTSTGAVERIRKVLGVASSLGGTVRLPEPPPPSLGHADTLQAGGVQTSATFGVTADPPRAKSTRVLGVAVGVILLLGVGAGAFRLLSSSGEAPSLAVVAPSADVPVPMLSSPPAPSASAAETVEHDAGADVGTVPEASVRLAQPASTRAAMTSKTTPTAGAKPPPTTTERDEPGKGATIDFAERK